MKKIIVCGDVDSGKSTFIGNLLKNNVGMYKGHGADLAEITDTLSAEKELNKTIHSSQYEFGDRTLINCPGHREYLKDTVSRMSEADSGILIVNKDTCDSRLTNLYKDLLDAFRIPYLLVYNAMEDEKRPSSFLFLEYDYIIDAMNEDVSMIVKRDLAPIKDKWEGYINTILFDDYDRVVGATWGIEMNLPSFKIVSYNDILTKYKVGGRPKSESRVIFYKGKEIVGCGIYG